MTKKNRQIKICMSAALKISTPTRILELMACVRQWLPRRFVNETTSNSVATLGRGAKEFFNFEYVAPK